MELLIYEELYHTPFKFDFEPPYCGKVDCRNSQNCNGNLGFNGTNSYFLKSHQSRTIVSKTTKISQEGLEKRAEHQEAKKIEKRNETNFTGFFKIKVQSKRAEKRRGRREKYKHYRTRD